MPVDSSGLAAYVLVDGRAVAELTDPEAAPRDWVFLRDDATTRQIGDGTKPEAAARCTRQNKCLVATTAGTRFELGVVNNSDKVLAVESYVDGRMIDSVRSFGSRAPPHVRLRLGANWGRSQAVVEGDYYIGAAAGSDQGYISADTCRPMRFAQLQPREEGAPATRDFGAAPRPPQAGRIDVIAREITTFGNLKPAGAGSGADAEGAAASAATKKDIFGLGTAFDAAAATAAVAAGACSGMVSDGDKTAPEVYATFSFRYAAIEALHIGKTNPKAWLDRETALIEVSRQSSRDLRRSLRAGFAISEPPTYLFSSKLSPLAGPGAPKAVADAAKLDKALRSEGFKLVGEPRSLFDALSHQLCGTHQLARYVEHVVATELRVEETYGVHEVDFEEQYGALYRPAGALLRYPAEWLAHFERCRSANDGHAAAGQRYDDDVASANGPPPLEAGDVVDVSKEDGSGVVESAVQGGDARAVLVKPPGGAQEEIPRSSWRLGGGGPRSRRGAHVAEQQTALLVQAFANAFGVRVFLLCVTGKKKQLRVVRVEPRNGRRVLINGYAIAHLGGVAFDSVARHHDVIEIQSGSESEEDVDVKPDPEPPAKRQRAAPAGRVKRERH